MNLNGFYDELMVYYGLNARKLPWRGLENPYAIWVSEVILQQTRVEQGKEYFMTFLRYFPDVFALANASQEELLKVWQGLGYYSRALNMHAAAKSIVQNHNGHFPSNYAEIRELKGIGDYTAAAISSIAFGLPYAAVDGNVKRVTSRIFGIQSPVDKPDTVAQMTSLLNGAIVNYPPGDFNQAMMELGALICTPRNPKCSNCPMQPKCEAFKNNLQAKIPVKSKKKMATEVHLDFFFFEENGNTAIVKRGNESIWKGLFEFPNVENAEKKDATKLLEYFGVYADRTVVLDVHQFTHKLTHRTIFAHFWHISGMPSNIVMKNQGYLRVPISDLEQFAVHRLMDKYLKIKVFKEISSNENDK